MFEFLRLSTNFFSRRAGAKKTARSGRRRARCAGGVARGCARSVVLQEAHIAAYYLKFVVVIAVFYYYVAVEVLRVEFGKHSL